jgi:mRNA deadenylase 3'-5' endonuclease subunit Ccr4
MSILSPSTCSNQHVQSSSCCKLLDSEHQSNHKFSILTFNCLADCYSQNPNKLNELNWENRKKNIENILINSQVDLILMQEIDHFDDFFIPLFKKIGNYKLIYLQRPFKEDGCLIAYNTDILECIEINNINYDDIGSLVDNNISASSQISSISEKFFLQQHNIGILSKFYMKSDVKKKEYVVVCTHLYWNPNKEFVKNIQGAYLLDKLYNNFAINKSNNKLLPIIIAGDLNSIPDSNLIKYMKQGFKTFSFKSALQDAINQSRKISGPATKFLCDQNLSKLCRWMRVLGIYKD